MEWMCSLPTYFEFSSTFTETNKMFTSKSFLSSCLHVYDAAFAGLGTMLITFASNCLESGFTPQIIDMYKWLSQTVCCICVWVLVLLVQRDLKKNRLFFRNSYIQMPETGSFFCFSINFPRGRFLISKDTTKSKMPSTKLKEIWKFYETRCFCTFQKMLEPSY